MPERGAVLLRGIRAQGSGGVLTGREPGNDVPRLVAAGQRPGLFCSGGWFCKPCVLLRKEYNTVFKMSNLGHVKSATLTGLPPACVILAHLSCSFRRQDAGQLLRKLPEHFIGVKPVPAGRTHPVERGCAESQPQQRPDVQPRRIAPHADCNPRCCGWSATQPRSAKEEICPAPLCVVPGPSRLGVNPPAIPPSPAHSLPAGPQLSRR